MDKLTEIKEKLDVIYKEYKDNKSKLTSEKTKIAAKLIVEMTFSNNVNLSDVTAELARFSVDVVKSYFESLTKSVTIPLEVLDEVLKEWYSTNKEAKLPQRYVRKFVFAITTIMQNYKDKALRSTQLPHLVVFIAEFAAKKEKNRNIFQELIDNTMAGIFILDYSNINKDSLINVWNATKALFPDLSKAEYESFITEWAAKYGFIASSALKVPTSTDNKVKIEGFMVSKETTKEATSAVVQTPVKTENISTTPNNAEPKAVIPDTDVSEKKEKPIAVLAFEQADVPKEKAAAEYNGVEKCATPATKVTPNKEAQNKMTTKSFYDSLKRDISKEQEAIITAFTDMITPIGKAFESIQGEISKSRELGIENVTLKAKSEELEWQLAEMRTKLQENNQSIMSAKAENSNFRQQVASLENKIAELDGKLNDAYAINSRESSLEAEKIRSELKKAFSFLYEDWLEYEFSDVSEENYESLQAIIKKIFRSLERNGIDFKGNN